jgi:hypothetical protein
VKSKPESIAGGRDLRFDTLRGLFLICMTVNHLPTEIRTVTDQSLGLFSAAEGFVFLSGLVCGWVYTRKLRNGGPHGLWNAALNRAKSIYTWHIASFVGALICVLLTEYACGYCAQSAPRLFFEHPLESLGLGAALLYQPGLLDLLPMYCVFVLLLPIVISGLESGRRWLVLSVSAAVWLAAQAAPAVDGAPIYPINTGSFNLLAWQLLFVAGLAIGHARASGQPQVSRPNRWVMAAMAALAVYGFGLRQFQWPSPWPDPMFGVLLNKPALGLLRLADFGAVAYLVAILGDRFPAALEARPLEFLGRHSLVVVATQSVAVMALLQYPSLFATPTSRTLVALGTVALVFAAAAARQGVVLRRAQAAPPPATPVSPAAGHRLSPSG